jgi:hypothetical protein
MSKQLYLFYSLGPAAIPGSRTAPPLTAAVGGRDPPPPSCYMVPRSWRPIYSLLHMAHWVPKKRQTSPWSSFYINVVKGLVPIASS